MNAINTMFGRTNENGDVVVLDAATGEAVTRIDANVYPIGSSMSARYEHAAGIVLTPADAAAIGLEIES